MLVLTRKLQEQIQIGDDIVITILKVRGQQVRVGIEAPRNVRVLRAELPRKADVAAASPPVITVELKPGVPVAVQATAALSNQPLATRLQARRAPRAGSTAKMSTKERLGPATLVATGSTE
jgi:carbon storage regulator CsrA